MNPASHNNNNIYIFENSLADEIPVQRLEADIIRAYYDHNYNYVYYSNANLCYAADENPGCSVSASTDWYSQCKFTGYC